MNVIDVLEERSPFHIHSALEDELRVDRTDITFQDVAGDGVRIGVTIHNDGAGPSAPTFLRLESAPLGAFVRWRPLAILPVPALEPGEARELSVEVKRPRPSPLGNFDRVPPSRVLTALSAPDDPSPPSVRLESIQNLLRRGKSTALPRPGPVFRAGSLSRDLSELVGRGQPHWAGNINVFVGRRAVERHAARALRVYPGRGNLAMFIVGMPGRPDAYAFDIVGLTPEWQAVLHDVTRRETLLVGSADRPMPETQWVEAAGMMMVMLGIRPPTGCGEGKVEVHVRQRSSEKAAVVEFDLDPAAQGTGCYTV